MSPSKISRVLVGVDFDDASASALRMAAVLAAAWDAAITIFHASTPDAPAYFTPDQIGMLEAERKQNRAAILAQLRLFATHNVRRAVDVMVEEGQPADALVRVAADFELIVVGTHRRHGVRRWWLGSVAEAVVRRSGRAVLVAPAGSGLLEGRRPTILAAGAQSAAAEAWVDLLTITFGGNVVRSPDIQQCAPERLEVTDLIVLSMPAAGDSHFGAITRVLKACVHPVLFIPSTGGTAKRSSS